LILSLSLNNKKPKITNAELWIAKSLIDTVSPVINLLNIIKKPKAADPNRAIHTTLLNPRKGFLDSLRSRDLKLGSKSDEGLLVLVKKKFKDDILILMPM